MSENIVVTFIGGPRDGSTMPISKCDIYLCRKPNKFTRGVKGSETEYKYKISRLPKEGGGRYVAEIDDARVLYI